ncbi:DUF3800 domain-containing protein [Microvirga lotononidis]|uniref:3-deoxy-D-manno-octulosonic acid transferase n=1 Tax=Microvirga lotononidis TaxID=864069 RepID=I4YZ51_9HYPH|nr:DUF3800 domain-containing protein [Microvirga lotononidis]EIM29243.1 hypothetical protein MicloDRAFT_00017150 [Microvirga lotononidis]WQO29076.1 DUF3800 domain-containing protein [Microvirga lotononidis]
MPSFSDYVIYVDESGDHDLTSINEDFPLFVLAFCIFKKSDYVREIVPAIQDFKFRWFGHDMVILHEREIRKQQAPFKFLQNQDVRQRFMDELSGLVRRSEFTLVASAIDKRKLKLRYASPENPYHIGLQFCMERTHAFLMENEQKGKVAHCMFERRGAKEDNILELELRRIRDRGNYTQTDMTELDICFADKKANSSGLQLADLVARPIGLGVLRPGQSNRTRAILAEKFRRSPAGKTFGWGLKIFP